MEQLLDLLLQNPWLILLIIFGILGNLGGSAAQKARRKQQREARQRRVREVLEEQRKGNDPFEEPAVTTTTRRIEDAGDDVGRRIRDILGRAQGERESEAVVEFVEPVVPTVPDRGGDVVGGGIHPVFETSLTKFEGGAAHVFEVSDFQRFADDLSDMDDDASRAEKRRVRLEVERRRRERRQRLPRGLKPQQVVLSSLLLGPPRALRSLEEESGRPG